SSRRCTNCAAAVAGMAWSLCALAAARESPPCSSGHRAPGSRALDQGAAIRAIPGKAEEGGSLVGWRPTTTPPGAARSPRARQACCRVLLADERLRAEDGGEREPFGVLGAGFGGVDHDPQVVARDDEGVAGEGDQ